MTNQDEADRMRRELIERRAYEIYKARGGLQDDLEEADWLQAEREVDGRGAADDLLPVPEDEEQPPPPREEDLP